MALNFNLIFYLVLLPLWGLGGFLFLNPNLNAQNLVLDSLYKNLKIQKNNIKTKNDTLVVLLHNELAYELRYIQTDSSLNLAKNNLKYAQKINFLRGVIGAEYMLGFHFANKNEYADALKIYYKCLENLEQVNDLRQKGRVLNNIAIVHYFQKKYDKGEDFLNQALKINLQIKNYAEAARCYNNLGRIYFDQKKYKEAFDFSKKTLKTVEENNVKGDFSVYYCNVAEYSLYLHQDKIAEEYALKSLESAEKTQNKRMIIRSNLILSEVYIDEEKLEKSSELLKIAGEKLQKNSFPEEEILYLESMYKLHEKKKDFAQSFYFFKKYIAIRDSTQSTKNYKTTLQQDFEYQNKLQEEQRKIERKNEFWIRSLLGLGLLLFGLLAFFIFRAFRIKSQTLSIISRQKNQIDEQRLLVEQTYQQLKSTSDELDKSIMYASRIQNLLLPMETEIKSFFAENFVIFKPKDKVSGDFYWFHQISPQKAIFVLGDCTGHGVSGAFMTMLSNALLYAVVHEKEVYSPADILNYLHESIFYILKQENGINGDGLDVACCMFEKNENNNLKITFAGSKASMYYVENDVLHKKSGDKQRIGGKMYEEMPFENQTFFTQNNTMFYFTSDGFYDQNNKARKKFGLPYLQELFLKNNQLPLSTQKNNFLNALHQHQDTEPQRDDIALVGLKVKV